MLKLKGSKMAKTYLREGKVDSGKHIAAKVLKLSTRLFILSYADSFQVYHTSKLRTPSTMRKVSTKSTMYHVPTLTTIAQRGVPSPR